MDRKMTGLNLTATIWEEEGAYVSKCPELEVASFGGTPAEALQRLKDAVDLYLENAGEPGIIDPGADRLLNRSTTFSRS
jgi:predicted RNase H-like HicB family nuclease